MAPERPGSAGAWVDDRLCDGFTTTPASDAWRAAEGVPCIVQVASDPNLAVGRVAWGPLAAGLTVSLSAVPQGAKVAVAGRGLAPTHPAWRVADELRAQGHPTIVVDCGWPRGGVDLVVYGGSVVVARALGRYLGVGT